MFGSDGTSLMVLALLWARFGDSPQCHRGQAMGLGMSPGTEHGGGSLAITSDSASAAAVATHRSARERGSLHPSSPWQPSTGMES